MFATHILPYALLLSTLLLTACGPYYRTISHYDTPATERGQACVFHCEQQDKHCRGDCQAHYEDCQYQAELQGKSDYLDAKEDWLNQQQRCQNKLKAKVKGESVCNAEQPRKHDYVHTSHCRKDCDCEADFDRCFQMCGGQIRYERHCVSNCESQ